MESPLEVLSRAATMVQDTANETRLTTKELPTAKWRRDRRLRATEYQHSISSSSSPSTPPSSPRSLPCNIVAKPLNETTNTTSSVQAATAAAVAASECPIDMSVTSTTIKPRTPPPPYREPLPGSTFASLARPSVITQAPPKRDSHHHLNNLISNRENDNRSTESISMCDPVIDEHFRRSLGADYMALFGKKSPPQAQQQSPQPQQQPQLQPPQQQPKPAVSPVSQRTTITVTNNNDTIGSSVDDHFAKALGDTWKKLQADKESKTDGVRLTATPPTSISSTPTLRSASTNAVMEK